MGHKLIKNSLLYTFGNMLPKFGSLFLLPVVTHKLGTTEYGVVQSMVILQGILLIILNLGLERSIFRLYFDYNSEEDKKRFLGTIFFGIIVFSSAMLGLMFLFSNSLSNIYETIEFYPFFTFTILSVYFSTFGVVYLSYLQVKQKASLHLALSVSKFVLNYALILFFILYLEQGAVGMLKGMMYSSLVFVPVYLFLSIREVKFTFDIEIIKSVFNFSWPFVPTLLFAWILNFSDRIFIERYLGQSEVGIYSLAYQLAMSLTVLFQAINKAYSPIFYGLANSEKPDIAKAKLSRYNQVIIYISLLFSLIFILFIPDVLKLLFPEEFWAAGQLIPLLVLSNVILVMVGLVKFGLYQNKRSALNMIVVIGTGLFNLALNFWLVPSYGTIGAVYSTLAAVILNLVLLEIFARKEFYISLGWVRLIPILVSIVLTYWLLHEFKFYFDSSQYFLIKIGISIMALFFCYKLYLKTFKRRLVK